MKFSIDKVKEILEEIEENYNGFDKYQISNLTNERIYHIRILIKENYIEGKETTYITDDIPTIYITGLTFSGHNLLASLRNIRIMEKIKKVAMDIGVSTLAQVSAIIISSNLTTGN